MREYPLITYVAFAAIAAWVVLSGTRRSFRKGTNRHKAASDIRWWVAIGGVILVLVLAK